MSKCDSCPIRVACSECDKELTCEEFKEYYKGVQNDNNK